MFSNFINGAVVTQHNHHNHAHNCVTPGFVQKDDYGNVARLQWTPDARFVFEVTSDCWIPVYEGSVILNQEGQTPFDVATTCDTFAYNTADYKCWKNECGTWVEQNDIVTNPSSRTAILFSKRSDSTRVIIKNFREEVVRTFESTGNNVSIEVDDTLAQELLQGYYNMDVYLVGTDTVRHIRRIAISIGNYVDKPNNGTCGCGSPSNILPNPSLDNAQQDAWELNRAFISVNTLDERDSLDCRTLQHGKLVRVANTPEGVKYYTWDQITYTWKDETFPVNFDETPVDTELSTTSTNPVQNKVVTEALENVKKHVVTPDWNQMDPTKPDFIKNKPSYDPDNRDESMTQNVGRDTNGKLYASNVFDHVVIVDQENGYHYFVKMDNGTLVSFTRCVGIEISNLPTKMTYYEGDCLDLSGIVIIGKREDGTLFEIDDYVCSVNEDSAVTESVCNFTYNECGEEFTTAIEFELQPFDPSIVLVDFDYQKESDGSYTITGWKETCNGQPSTELIIPNNSFINV